MALIYIVEDDENIREIETIALKNSNYMVCAFEKAKDLYKKIDEIKAIENVYVFYTNEGLDVKLPGEIIAAGEYVKVEKNTIITADGKDNYVIYKVKK